MKYFFILIFCITLTNTYAQDSTKLFFPPNSLMKNAFLGKNEIYNLKMHGEGIIMHAQTDSIFINYNCKVNSIYQVAGLGMIEFDIGNGYILWLVQLKNWAVAINETLKQGQFIGTADTDDTDEDFYTINIILSKRGKLIDIDQHLDFFHLKR